MAGKGLHYAFSSGGHPHSEYWNASGWPNIPWRSKRSDCIHGEGKKMVMIMSKTIIMLSRLIKVCNRLATATSTGRIRPPTFTEPRWEPTTTSSSGTTSLFWRRRAGTKRPWRKSCPTWSRRSWPPTWRWRWSSCWTQERWTCPPGGRGKICEKLENSESRLWLRIDFDFSIPNPWAEGKG